MAGAAAGESVTVAGLPERVAVARAFAMAVLGRQHPAGATVVLLVSELVTNSVRHSASGLPGWTVTVTVPSSGEVTRVQVTDMSGTTVPALRPAVSGMEGGRGCTSWMRWPLAGGSSRMAVTPPPGSSFSTADRGTAQHRGQVFWGSVPPAGRLASSAFRLRSEWASPRKSLAGALTDIPGDSQTEYRTVCNNNHGVPG
jgi:hypothetical protein